MKKLSEGNVGWLVADVVMETVSCLFTSGREIHSVEIHGV